MNRVLPVQASARAQEAAVENGSLVTSWFAAVYFDECPADCCEMGRKQASRGSRNAGQSRMTILPLPQYAEGRKHIRVFLIANKALPPPHPPPHPPPPPPAAAKAPISDLWSESGRQCTKLVIMSLSSVFMETSSAASTRRPLSPPPSAMLAYGLIVLSSSRRQTDCKYPLGSCKVPAAHEAAAAAEEEGAAKRPA
jgi:hypothetical protein